MVESFAIPLACKDLRATLPTDSFPNTVMLYGPPGTGKTMLIKALAKEVGANLFDLSPKTTDGKYPKKQTAMMMHLVFKMARALQPSVIYIGDAELAWLGDKKKLKEHGAGLKEAGTRIQKDLIKELKALEPDDQILVIGETNKPYILEKGDLKKFQAFWKRLVFCPMPDYASLQALFTSFIKPFRGVVAPDMDIGSLAHTCHIAGFSAGAVHRAIQDVFNPRVLQRLAKRKDKITTDSMIAGLVKQEPVYSQTDMALRAWMSKLGPKKSEDEEGGDDAKGKGDGKGKGKGKKK